MSKRILIVEDNPADLKMMERAIKEVDEGLELTMVQKGEDGLNAFQATKHDLVVLDTLLPGMDGFEVCERIKEASPETQVVMLTGSLEGVDDVKAQKCGVDKFLLKSMEFASLKDFIRENIS